MQTIYKYKLDQMAGTITIPVGAQFLSAGIDCNDDICLWFKVDAQEEAKIERRFVIMGTGWPLDELVDFEFLETVKVDPYIWHIFLEKEKYTTLDNMRKIDWRNQKLKF